MPSGEKFHDQTKQRVSYFASITGGMIAGVKHGGGSSCTGTPYTAQSAWDNKEGGLPPNTSTA